MRLHVCLEEDNAVYIHEDELSLICTCFFSIFLEKNGEEAGVDDDTMEADELM